MSNAKIREHLKKRLIQDVVVIGDEGVIRDLHYPIVYDRKGKLRKRLIEELALRGYSDKTKEAYVHAVAGLAQRYDRSPDKLTDTEVRAYLLEQHLETNKSASTPQCVGKWPTLLSSLGIAAALRAPGTGLAAGAPSQAPTQGL